MKDAGDMSVPATTVTPMNVHTANETQAMRLIEVRDALLPGAMPEDNTHLDGVSMLDVVDKFWPAGDGWALETAENGSYYMLFLLTHPTDGVAVTLLSPAARTGPEEVTLDSWDTLTSEQRAHRIFFSSHAHGATRLDILDQFETLRHNDQLKSRESAMLGRYFQSPAFCDEPTALLMSLGTYTGLHEHAARFTAFTEPHNQ